MIPPRLPRPIGRAIAAAAAAFSFAASALLLASPTLLLAAPALLAQALPLAETDEGTYTAEIDDAPIFDLSGKVPAGDTGGIEIETRHDASGRVAGTVVHLEDGGYFESRMDTVGKVSGANGSAVVALKSRSVTTIGGEVDSTALQVSKGRIAPDGKYEGVVKTRFCSRYIQPCTVHAFPFAIQRGSGDWTIRLTLDGVGTRVFGAVSIVVSVDHAGRQRVFDYLAEGRFSASKGVATLKLVAADGSGAPPLRLKARMTPSDGIEPWRLDGIDAISGSLLGQRIAIKAAK